VLLTQVSVTLGIQYRGLQSISLVYFNCPRIPTLQDFWKDKCNWVGRDMCKRHCVCWPSNTSWA